MYTNIVICIISIVVASVCYRLYYNYNGKLHYNQGIKMSKELENVTSVYDFKVKKINGEEISLSEYKGKVLLIVNVASQCGLTKDNYKELVELDEKFKEKGLEILAFPCNQFGGQEPGTADDICEFVKKRNVSFQMFEKISVNGENAHPLFKYLKTKLPGTIMNMIKWNFTKFIVDRNGIPVERHSPTVSPLKLVSHIEKYL